MRQSRRRTTPVVYTQPKTTAISEATRIALLRDQLDILNEQYNFNFNTMPPPASGPTLLGPTGLPLSPSTAAATGIPPAAPAGVNPGVWQRIWSRAGAQLGEGLLTRVTPWIIENVFALGLAGLAVAIGGGHAYVARERWQRGDKIGTLIASLGGIGGVMSQIPWFPVKVVGYFTWLIMVLWDQWRETPEGKTAIAEVDQKIKEQTPAGPSGATPASKPAEPKPAEPKPAEPKPAEPKPAEPKPAEPKPAEPKPAPPPEKGPNPAGSIGKINWSKLKSGS